MLKPLGKFHAHGVFNHKTVKNDFFLVLSKLLRVVYLFLFFTSIFCFFTAKHAVKGV